jgi:hypothetical protein
VVNFQDVTHLSSLNDDVIMETTWNKASDINVGKLENKDGHLKVDGEMVHDYRWKIIIIMM